MEIPPVPKDTGLKNIIDKLAEFVARNGPEFEIMTKTKQKGNPKFTFLYGGEHYQYYQYKVLSEQNFLKQTNQPQNIISANNLATFQNLAQSFSQMSQIWSNPPTGGGQQQQQQLVPKNPVNAQIESINIQQNALREQIRQSEQNLSAQHGVLLQQQQSQIDEAVARAQSELIQKQAVEHNIQMNEFETVLQPIIDSCTKESISNGKSWILQQCTDSSKCHIISQALVNGVPFTQKLHLIYLINDVIHHCVRKNNEDLKKCLENIVIPMFCSAQINSTEEQSAKLTKLLSLWESKMNFFDACVISKLRSPPSSLQEYQTSLLNQHQGLITQLTQATKLTFESYKQQHQAFIQHAGQQIAILENQKQQIEQQTLTQLLNNVAVPPHPLLTDLTQPPNQNNNSGNNNRLIQQNSQNNNIISNNIASLLNVSMPPVQSQQNFNNSCYPQLSHASSPSSSLVQQQQQQQQKQQQYPNNMSSNNTNNSNNNNSSNNSSSSGNGGGVADFSLPPPNFSIPIPDLSKPPPGFQPITNEGYEDLTPSIPYFELPAGLMVPLIRLEDYNYKPLDPNLIRLPPPTPPSERLLSAVEAFYSMPSHDRPRDGEGWEKLALYEYFKVKNAAKKQKEDEIANGLRSRSKSPSPITMDFIKSSKKIKKRVYCSKSRSRSPRSRSKSRSPDLRKSRSRRSRSPVSSQSARQNRSITPPRRNNSRTPPPIRKERERPIAREKERSISPPSFMSGNYAKAATECIEESNKGHQMLMKMGWGGSGGLGSQSQGIDTPISGGEVREKRDMYKGVGLQLQPDPYENFRKNKGAAFITRMKARAEERS